MKRTGWMEKIEAWPRAATLGAVVGLALALRLLLLIALPQLGDPDGMDTANYLHLTRSLLESGSFAMWAKPTAYVAPVYPFFLAGVFKIFGENLLAVKLIHVLLGTASVALVYCLAARIMRPFVALLAALLMAVHPEIIGITGFIYTETLFIFLLLMTLVLFQRALATKKVFHFVCAGALLGLTTLCRGVTLQWPVFMVVVIMLSSQRWVWLRRWAFAVAGMALVMAPWTIRNYQHFRVFLPVATGSGDVFWTGNYLEFDGEYRYQETQAKLFEVAGDVDLVTRDRRLMADAKRMILEEPLAHAWLFVRKIFRYWLRVYEDVPHGEARQRNWVVFGVLAMTHYLILLLALIGLWRCNWRNEDAKTLLAFVCYYTLVHAATLAVARYRIPLLPLLSIAAAGGLFGILRKFNTREAAHD
jgi:4-amino-4-deoxy-L-arabinose transferase-like glycosyltransferase